MSVIRTPRCRSVAICTLLAILPIGGCSTRVESTGTYAAPVQGAAMPLPRPRRILVTDFSANGNSVQLDQGIAARVSRQFDAADPSAAQYRTSLDVQQAISETLVGRLRKMGLPAERAENGAVPGRDDLIIQGQILRISEGNRTRRLAVGFGAGKSDVQAKVQVYYQRPDAPPQLLQTYDADANSGRRPGLAIGGVAAAGGSLAPLAAGAALGLHSEIKRTGVAEEGERLADHLAGNLARFFAQQGWIPQSALPAPSLR